jgi:hypothetical protein
MANCLASFLLLGSIDFPSKENGCCTYDKVGAAYMEHSENKINIYSVLCIISYTFSVKLQLLTANCSPGWTDTLWSKASTTCALQISCSGPSSCTQVGEVMSDSVARTGILEYWNTGILESLQWTATQPQSGRPIRPVVQADNRLLCLLVCAAATICGWEWSWQSLWRNLKVCTRKTVSHTKDAVVGTIHDLFFLFFQLVMWYASSGLRAVARGAPDHESHCGRRRRPARRGTGKSPPARPAVSSYLDWDGWRGAGRRDSPNKA